MGSINDYESEKSPLDLLRDEIKQELDQGKRELNEISLMLEQSQLEVSKLTQRNTAITTHLQQIQSQIESLPRSDIRMAYDAALEAQQRLFLMRGQLEKLQSDQSRLKRLSILIDKVIHLLESNQSTNHGASSSQSTVETVEMMVEAQEAERLRLSRQMHDGPAQALSNFILQTEIAMRLFDINPAKAKDELSNLKMSATGAFQQVRDFIFELRPMMLDDLGLLPTVKRYIDALKDHPGIEIQVILTGVERRLESYLEAMIFRAIQELITNSVKHSQASLVKLYIDVSDVSVKVTVDDNGKGFDIDILNERGRMGIKLIKERVEQLGGYFQIDSIVGKGSRIIFQVPTVQI